MDTEQERYQLCLQCSLEGGYASFSVRKIRLHITLKDKWKNQFVLDGFFGDKVKDAPKLCPDCPYKLEHIALVQEEVYEMQY